LRENEERLRLAQSAEGFGTFDWDIPAQKIIWSAETERMWGLPVGGFEGTYEHWRRLVHPDDVVEAERIARLSLENPDIPCLYDHRIIQPDGTVRWIHAKATTLRDAIGRPVRMVGVNLDITERKRAEEALRQSEERWHLAATGTTDGIWDWDVAGHAVFLSARWKQLRGYCESEIGVDETEWSSRIHPEDFSRVMATVQSYFNKEIPAFNCEYRTRRKDGTYFWISDRGVAVWDEQGRVVRMVGSETDITERKRAEEALRESEIRFRTMAEAVPSFLFETDAAGWNIWTSEGWCRFTGQTPEQVAGHGWAEALHPDDRAANIDRWMQCMKEGVPFEAQQRLRRTDGTYAWVIARALPVRDNEGQVTRWVGSVTNVDDIVCAQDALRQSEERFRAFTSATNDVVYGMSPDWTEMRHLRGREFIADTLEPSRNWLDTYIPVDDQRHVMETIQRAIRSKSVFELEHRVIRVDGSLGWTHARAIPILDDRGEILEWFGAASDVTQRKQAEEALRQLNETLEQRVIERSAALRESEGRLQGMLEHSPNLIFIKDLQGRYVDINKQFEQTFHLMRQDIIGKTDHDIFPPEEAAAYRANDLEVLKAGRSLQFEEAALHDDGFHRNIVWKFPLRRLDGTPYAICGIVTDITQLKRAEAALRDREHEFHLLADNVPAYFSYVDTELRYRFLNKRYEELFDRPLDELTGQYVKDVVGKDNFSTIEPHLREALTGREASFIYQMVLSNDDARWMNVHYMPDRDETGRIRGVLALVTDVTSQKRSELALQQNQLVLQEKREELQMLTEKLFKAQDSERQRIARDLHDDFSQRLAALVLDVASLQRHPRLLPELIGKALEPVREELKQLSDDLRQLAHRLHPSLLKHAGLGAALEEYIQQAMQRTGLNITLKASNAPDSLPLDLATCLFRVCQESLQNVVKHAKATEVLVKLSGSSKGIGLSVTDNGTGFDSHDKSSHQKGLGVTSMQERLRLLNGFLNIHSRVASGTKVCAWIPFQEKTS